MKNCIVCLPLTIPSKIKAGLVLTPFVVSMVSQLSGIESVCCINLTGLRYEGLEVDEITRRFENFRKLLRRLGAPIDHYWIDSDASHINRLQKYCEKLVANGELQSRSVSIAICQCGAVEVLAEALHADWLMEHKVIRWEKNRAFCTLCNTPLKTELDHCLLLESDFGNGTLTMLPSFYAKECGALRTKFGQPMLISRRGKGDYRVSLFDRVWRLDTDFCWSFLFQSLIEDGLHPSAVVVSNRSLKPLIWSLGLSRKLSDSLQDMTVIVTPFMKLNSERLKSPNAGTLHKLIDRYGQLPIRLFMASGLKWGQKDVVMSSDTIFWSLKALSHESAVVPNVERTILPLSETLPMMEGRLTEQLITDLRKESSVPLSQYQNLLLERRV